MNMSVCNDLLFYRSNSLPNEDSQAPGRPKAAKPSNVQMVRSPPPLYHTYGNDMVAERHPVRTPPSGPIELDYLQTRPDYDVSPTKSEMSVVSTTSSAYGGNDRLPLVGWTATLPKNKEAQQSSAFKRSLSRSAEDLSEHMRRSVRQNEYVYSNDTFQMGEDATYSYATVPRNVGGSADASNQRPHQGVRRKKPATDGYAKVDKAALRKSLSNPTLLEGNGNSRRPAQRPMHLRLITRHDAMASAAANSSPLSTVSANISSPSTASTSVASPLSLAGINMTPQTRTFTKKKSGAPENVHPLAGQSPTLDRMSNGAKGASSKKNKENEETIC